MAWTLPKLRPHLGTFAQGLETHAVEVTNCSVSGVPVLPALVQQIPDGESLERVSADDAYDT